MKAGDSINQLKQRLETDPDVVLLDFSCFPAAKDEEILALEKSFSQEFPAVLKELYKFSNGLQVRWNYKSTDLPYQSDIEKSRKPFPWLWPAEHYWQLDGVINILPLEEVFDRDYKDFMWFDFEKDYKARWNGIEMNMQAFKKNLRPFDVYDKYYTVAIYPDQQYPVLLGEDHNADFLNYLPLNFSAYFEFLLDSRGAVNERVDFFNRKKE